MTVPDIRESLAAKQKAAEEKIKTIDVSCVFFLQCFIAFKKIYIKNVDVASRFDYNDLVVSEGLSTYAFKIVKVATALI